MSVGVLLKLVISECLGIALLGSEWLMSTLPDQSLRNRLLKIAEDLILIWTLILWDATHERRGPISLVKLTRHRRRVEWLIEYIRCICLRRWHALIEAVVIRSHIISI